MSTFLGWVSERLVALAALFVLVAAAGAAPLRAQSPSTDVWSLPELAKRLMPAFPVRECRDEREPVIEQVMRRCYLRRNPGGTDTLMLQFSGGDSLTGVYWTNLRFRDETSAARFVDSLALDLAAAHFVRWRCPPDSGNGFSIRIHFWTRPGATAQLGLSQRAGESLRLSLFVIRDATNALREDFCPLGEIVPAPPTPRRSLVARPHEPSRGHPHRHLSRHVVALEQRVRGRDLLEWIRRGHRQPHAPAREQWHDLLHERARVRDTLGERA